ncbi:MAG: hypothetical protein QOG87_871 [Actinomycetota bacterium]
MLKKSLLALCIVPAFVAGMLHVPSAFAQAADDQAGVGIQPLDTKTSDPNGGQWFYKQGAPGDVLEFKARLVNLATVERTVKMYLADLNFSSDGTPQIPGPGKPSQDIGTWGTGEQSYTLAANAKQDITFKVVVPDGADPGDHVGVVVIENPPQKTTGQAFNIVKRVSTRLYVTVPGDAKPAMKVESVTIEPDSSIFPREATVRVTLRNTGTIGLRPNVTVNGEKATGPDVMLTKSIEHFVVTKKVPLWGGPQSYRVDVTSLVGVTTTQNRIGPVDQVRVSRFYFPWMLLIALTVLGLFVFMVRRWLRKRAGRYAAMRADMKRIERLLSEQRSGGTTPDEDPEVAIKAAIKRAGRAGDKESEEKLKEKLAEHRAAVAAPAPDPEPVVATTPPPAPEPVAAPALPDEPVPATAGSSTYDWLLDDSPPVATEGPKDFYDSLRDADEPAEPSRTPVQSAMGPGYFVPDPAPPAASSPVTQDVAEDAAPDPEPVVARAPQPEPVSALVHATAVPPSEHVDALAALLRELKTAPKKRQEALLQAARSYGVLTLRAHAELIDELPPDVRVKLLPKQWAI